MPQKVIGLDVGLRSIKAVQLTSTLRGFELTHFARIQVPYSENDDGLNERSRMLESLLKENGFSGDTIISSIPGNRVMVHYLELPFTDSKKVQQVVKYELEPYLPMPIDEIVVDSQIMERPKGENAHVLTAAVKKTIVEEHLQSLKGAGIDPKIIDAAPLASYNCLVYYDPKALQGVTLFLDMGGDHSSLTILVNGLPKAYRTISYGGDTITSSLAAALEIPPDEAEAVKRATPLSLGENIEGAPKALAEAMDPLVSEIRITLHSVNSLLKDQESFQIILTGGGSRIMNIEDFLSRLLGIPARHFEPFEDCPLGLGDIDPGEQHHMTTAIGLALRGINRGVAQTNLRQEEFSVLHRLHEVRGKLAFLGIALAFVLALGAADILVSLHIKESRYQGLKQDVRHVFKETFPDIRNVVDELQQARVRIKEEKNRASLLGGFLGQDSMMDILEAVHQAIPRQLEVRITDLNADEKWVLLSGETNAFDVVDKVKASLSASPLFQEVKIESAKMSKIAGVVEFKFKAQRKL